LIDWEDGGPPDDYHYIYGYLDSRSVARIWFSPARTWDPSRKAATYELEVIKPDGTWQQLIDDEHASTDLADAKRYAEEAVMQGVGAKREPVDVEIDWEEEPNLYNTAYGTEPHGATVVSVSHAGENNFQARVWSPEKKTWLWEDAIHPTYFDARKSAEYAYAQTLKGKRPWP